MPTNYLTTLNPEQKKAVLYKDGPLLIVAGAGAGKTKTITHRIAHLIHTGTLPHEILAVTFTNKAAEEMRERVRTLIQKNTAWEKQPFVGTFHRLGVHILREYGNALGIKKNFKIKDRSDSLTLIKEAMKSLSINTKTFSPAKIQTTISRQKGELINVEEYKNTYPEYPFSRVAAVWEIYESLLKKENSLDFDDLLVKPVSLLGEKPRVASFYQNKWRFIHVDEYQDTNTAQYEMVRLLSALHKNICVVGDSDQNIYSWRGARIQNILRFEDDYPNATVILLEENYRSTKTILAAANEVIKKNTLRKEKNLFTHNKDGDRLSLSVYENETEEAYAVADTAAALQKKSVRWDEIAILFRANFQSRILEEAFLTRSIPYRVIGTRFFERKEVKNILSYLRAALDRDSLEDIKRVVNVPLRGVGKVTLVKLFSGKQHELNHSMQKKLKKFFSLLDYIKKTIHEKKPSEAIKLILEDTGLHEHLKKEGEDGLERLENIKELVTIAKRYDEHEPRIGIEELLTHASLAEEGEELVQKKDGVKLMTVHAAKGLEFRYVFIVGLEQGLFPHEKETSDRETDEEERRLFYVALTRAKEKLFLSLAKRRTIFGIQNETFPSKFIADIPPELIETAPAPSIII